MASVKISDSSSTHKSVVSGFSSVSAKSRKKSAPGVSLSKSDKGLYHLSTPVMFASSVVLEEAADQLTVMAFMGDLPHAEADLTYKTLESRFGHKITDTHIFDPNTIEPYEIALDKEKLFKFQKDRSFVEKIIRETIQQLLDENRYDVLVKYLLQHNRQVDEESQLLHNEMINKARLIEVKNLLEKERRESLSGIQTLSETIGNLKDQLEDLIFESKIKMHYIETWENSRIEQNTLGLRNSEQVYLNNTKKRKTEIEREMRISAEIEAYISQTQKEYQEAIQMWMERYDKEIELRDTEIQVLKEKREEQFSQLQQVSKLYEDHRRQIEEYLQYKAVRRQEAELLAKKHKAATKIQAWWRGTMVRKGFGPFMKKKGGKKGKEDKKKGKK